MTTAIELFEENTLKTKGVGCWWWTGRKSRGYGVMSVNGKRLLVHRWSYEKFVGPIPKGLQIGHLCDTRACVRPDHLVPVTNRENSVQRTEQILRCPSGHSYAKHGKWYTGKRVEKGKTRETRFRVCLECRKTHNARHNSLR